MKTFEQTFPDISAPLDMRTAKLEASRCYYCYDAPCIQACPTEIDIPGFIRKIGNGNIRGAALEILKANIMGGTCARACPVETLCQSACVREHEEKKPVEIGLLQRFATDEFFNTGEQPFKRAPSSGKRVAVVGAGPAGLSCAHRLAMLGHDVTVFEAREKSGGLNEFGLAPYKMTNDFAQKEVKFLLGIGGITVKHGHVLGKNVVLAELRKDFSAVFLGMGLGSTNSLGVPGEDLDGVIDAVKFIEKIRQTKNLKLPVGRHVVVIGGGNTAVDISIQMKRLGAEFVTMVYRRGTEQMGATGHEQELAQTSGVLLKTWAKPVKVLGEGGKAKAVEFEHTELDPAGNLVGTGNFFSVAADQVFKAIGQKLVSDALCGLEITDNKIAVDEDFQTILTGVYAGGDCTAKGEDLTVTGVQHGKLAAIAIDKMLGGMRG